MEITFEKTRIGNDTATNITVLKNKKEIGRIYAPDEEPAKFMVTSDNLKGSKYFKTQKAAEKFIIRLSNKFISIFEAIASFN